MISIPNCLGRQGCRQVGLYSTIQVAVRSRHMKSPPPPQGPSGWRELQRVSCNLYKRPPLLSCSPMVNSKLAVFSLHMSCSSRLPSLLVSFLLGTFLTLKAVHPSENEWFGPSPQPPSGIFKVALRIKARPMWHVGNASVTVLRWNVHISGVKRQDDKD